MRIAQIAPLVKGVPPQTYGGSERIVHYVTEELVRLGHEVTLFASGDSMTSAELVPCVPRALRLEPKIRDVIPYFMLLVDRVYRRADSFDILHFHIDQFHFPLFRSMSGRTVTTLHGRQDLPDCRRGCGIRWPGERIERTGRACHTRPPLRPPGGIAAPPGRR